MLVPIGIGLLATGAWIMQKRRERAPISEAEKAERAVVFDTAINQVKDPEKLRALAKAFRSEGLDTEATLLDQRADLNTASPEEKAERTAIYKQAMASKNPAAIREVATAFDEIGATGAAVSLRQVATGLETSGMSGEPSSDETPAISGDSD